MATKNNPGKFDCYENAAPDEPMFVLLARDDLAPHLVRIWAFIRDNAPREQIAREIDKARELAISKDQINEEKYKEARTCADNMYAWKLLNPGA